MESRKREGQQLLLRFPEGSNIRDRLDELARENNRSLTAEIIHRLTASIEDSSDARSVVAARRLLSGTDQLELEQRLSKLESAFQAFSASKDTYDLEMRIHALE